MLPPCLVPLDALRFALPSLTGTLSGKAYPVGPSAGAVVNARPVPGFFMVVWIILYILIGVAWVLAILDAETLDGTESELKTIGLALDFGFLALTGMLAAWSYMYVRVSKRHALFTLMGTVLFLAIGLEVLRSFGLVRSTMLLLPLLVWAGFATLFNFTEVNMDPKENPMPMSMQMSMSMMPISVL
jgi:tryptophan-rich sensory protein